MRLLKKAGKNVVKMSKSEWLTMGKKAGWINKKAQIGIPEEILIQVTPLFNN